MNMNTPAMKREKKMEKMRVKFDKYLSNSPRMAFD